MGTVTVEGTYRNGVVELDEEPSGAQENARVVVTFSPTSAGDEAARRKEAVKRLLTHMEQGFRLGGRPYVTRDEIYDERIDRPR